MALRLMTNATGVLTASPNAQWPHTVLSVPGAAGEGAAPLGRRSRAEARCAKP